MLGQSFACPNRKFVYCINMFVLTVLRDTLRVMPADFSKTREDALKDEINRKYSNKVLHDIGLCMLVHDLLEIDEGVVQHSEGWIWIKVKFRMIVFRPFKGETLVGRVRSSSPDGIQVSMEFFDDIEIPKDHMKMNCDFNTEEGVWIWRDEDGQLFYADLGEQIRFQVLESKFLDISPPRPQIGDVDSVPISHSPPYSLICSIVDPGLGLLSWW